MNSNDILVLVHPGSACGSANFNIGRREANDARLRLADALDQWEGGIYVIDGELSQELSEYPALGEAIEGALLRARQKGLLSQRVLGDDNAEADEPTQVERAKELAASLPDHGERVRFEVTGAWYHPEDGGGCVGSVIQSLREVGCEAELSSSAVHLLDEIPDDEPVKLPSWMKP